MNLLRKWIIRSKLKNNPEALWSFKTSALKMTKYRAELHYKYKNRVALVAVSKSYAYPNYLTMTFKEFLRKMEVFKNV